MQNGGYRQLSSGKAARGAQPGERIFFYDGSKTGGVVWRSGLPLVIRGPDSEMFYEFDFIEHDLKI